MNMDPDAQPNDKAVVTEELVKEVKDLQKAYEAFTAKAKPHLNVQGVASLQTQADNMCKGLQPIKVGENLLEYQKQMMSHMEEAGDEGPPEIDELDEQVGPKLQPYYMKVMNTFMQVGGVVMAGLYDDSHRTT